MTIEIIQTCNKCGKKRELPTRTTVLNGNIDHQRQVGGWREIDDKDICPDDIKKIFE